MTYFFNPTAIHHDFVDLGHKVPNVDIKAIDIALSSVATKDQGHGRTVRYIEIGTFAGVSACYAAKMLEFNRGCSAEITVIDAWGDGAETDPELPCSWSEVKSTFYRNIDLIGVGKWKVLHGRSSQFATEISHRGPFDVAYIDGDHTRQGVLSDYRLLWDNLYPWGVLIGHDYGVFPGVNEACDIIGVDGVIGTTWFKFKELH